jgi:hypothetical protein
MALLRWVILQVVLCAALVALWMMGPLAQVFASEARWYVSGVVLLAGVGLVLSALSRQDGAARTSYAITPPNAATPIPSPRSMSSQMAVRGLQGRCAT